MLAGRKGFCSDGRHFKRTSSLLNRACLLERGEQPYTSLAVVAAVTPILTVQNFCAWKWIAPLHVSLSRGTQTRKECLVPRPVLGYPIGGRQASSRNELTRSLESVLEFGIFD